MERLVFLMMASGAHGLLTILFVCGKLLLCSQWHERGVWLQPANNGLSSLDEEGAAPSSAYPLLLYIFSGCFIGASLFFLATVYAMEGPASTFKVGDSPPDVNADWRSPQEQEVYLFFHLFWGQIHNRPLKK